MPGNDLDFKSVLHLFRCCREVDQAALEQQGVYATGECREKLDLDHCLGLRTGGHSAKTLLHRNLAMARY
jgi:hypothetical protein